MSSATLPGPESAIGPGRETASRPVSNHEAVGLLHFPAKKFISSHQSLVRASSKIA